MIERPIGILGGTFDPVHVGHLRFALEAFELLNLAAVRMLPLNCPNHRAPPVVTAARRFELLQGAVDGTRIIADDRELRRDGVSYTIDTLESLQVEFPNQPLCLLLGADAFHGLCGWHRWQELLANCHLVVAERPDSDADLDPRLQQLINTVAVTDPDKLADELCGRIFFLPIPLLPVSSTDIRARIGCGRDISFLVAASVQRTIEQHQLYKSPE